MANTLDQNISGKGDILTKIGMSVCSLYRKKRLIKMYNLQQVLIISYADAIDVYV